jgi:hypothetical protein
MARSCTRLPAGLTIFAPPVRCRGSLIALALLWAAGSASSSPLAAAESTAVRNADPARFIPGRTIVSYDPVNLLRHGLTTFAPGPESWIVRHFIPALALHMQAIIDDLKPLQWHEGAEKAVPADVKAEHRDAAPDEAEEKH